MLVLLRPRFPGYHYSHTENIHNVLYFDNIINEHECLTYIKMPVFIFNAKATLNQNEWIQCNVVLQHLYNIRSTVKAYNENMNGFKPNGFKWLKYTM